MIQPQKSSGQVSKEQNGRENEPEGCRTEDGRQRMRKRTEAWAREEHAAETDPKESWWVG